MEHTLTAVDTGQMSGVYTAWGWYLWYSVFRYTSLCGMEVPRKGNLFRLIMAEQTQYESLVILTRPIFEQMVILHPLQKVTLPLPVSLPGVSLAGGRCSHCIIIGNLSLC